MSPPSVRSVTARQVSAFRLRRHHLSDRRPASEMLDVVARVGGLQSQLLSAARMGLGARTWGLSDGAVDRALSQDRALARAWCMRQTLHLLPGRDLATFVRGCAGRVERELVWLRRRGISDREIERLISAVLDSLGEPATKAELVERVAALLRLPTAEARGGGWGNRGRTPCLRWQGLTVPAISLIHLAGARGVVCFGPGDADAATFVRAERWVPGFRDLPPDQAQDELLRRYLGAFGPAQVGDFVAWTRMRLRDARPIWHRIEGELARVDVEGAARWLLERDLAELDRPDADLGPARLLPFFDAFLLGHGDRTHIIARSHHPHVYRPQGWVSPSVLVDGRVAGTWSHALHRDGISVEVRGFAPLAPQVRAELTEDAAELARFLGLRFDRVAFPRRASTNAPSTRRPGAGPPRRAQRRRPRATPGK